MLIKTHRILSNRRGMAMLLVIISLMMATILTTSYLASRDNSTLIGANAGGGATARGAALSGLEMGLAMMQTNTAWRTVDPNGILINNVTLGDATVNVQVTDEITNHAPTASSQYLLLTSKAVVNGITETADARVYVPLNAGNTVDVDLSEFAVFFSTRMDMANHATITQWPKSPMVGLGGRTALGTRATSSASIVMTDTAGAIDSSVFVGPGASSSLVSIAGGPALQKVALLDPIPLPASPDVGVPATVLIPLPSDMTQSGGTATVLANVRYRSAELKSNAVRTVQGNLKVVAERDYKINSGGKLVINGNVKLAVFGNLIMDQGAIELMPNATLSIYIRGGGSTTEYALRVKDSYIGEQRANSLRDNSGNAPYFDPSRITIYSMPPSGSAQEWLLEKNSVVKGSLYAPDAVRVTIQEESALYGRAATKVVRMTDDGAVFFDPMLNSQYGFTTNTSPLFDATGHILSGYATLASLDTSALQTVSNLYSIVVKGISFGASDATPASAPADTTPVGVGGATARPIHLQYELLSVSSDVHDWETGANSAGVVQVGTSDKI